MVKVILHKLDKSSITAMIQHGSLALHSKEILPLVSLSESIQDYLELLLQQHECITELAPLIEQYAEELVTALTPQQGWEIEFFPQGLSWTTCGWLECSACGNISFSFLFREKDMEHHQCPKPTKGIYKINTPRLLKAYRAASTSAI
jgi:hypothetical protein